MTEIKNIPNYAQYYMFIVAKRNHDRELVFWGAYLTEEIAHEVATLVGGMVIRNF